MQPLFVRQAFQNNTPLVSIIVMKIFYAVQATGNGHIARASWLLPYLQNHGSVDLFLSGSNSTLNTGMDAKFKSKGVSLYYSSYGGLDYAKIFKSFNPLKLLKEAKALPIQDYDIIINDFEPITALACSLKKMASIGFGHQASFQSKLAPRPARKSMAGEWVLTQYAKATQYVGLHFKSYDHFICNPVLSTSMLNAQPKDEQHITIYLSHYHDDIVMKHIEQLPDLHFHLFSKTEKGIRRYKNILLQPVGASAFQQSMINCTGVITGAGFETPAEALLLKKKLLCMPIKGQYEQWCNAAALKAFHVPILPSIESDFSKEIANWINAPAPDELILTKSVEEIVQDVIRLGMDV